MELGMQEMGAKISQLAVNEEEASGFKASYLVQVLMLAVSNQLDFLSPTLLQTVCVSKNSLGQP